MARPSLSLWLLALLVAAACAEAPGGSTGDATSSEVAGDPAVEDAAATVEDAVAEDAVAEDAGPQPAAPRPYAGTCPTLSSGQVVIDSAGMPRRVRVFLPAQPWGAPVLFLWHGLGDNAKNLAAALGAAKTATDHGVIVVAPDSCCNYQDSNGCCPLVSGWGFISKPEPDLALFDDVLACLDQQFGIDRRRVYTSGFSAGALWSTLLVMHRAEHLAAAALWSGGVNDLLPYATPFWKLPVLVAWGGSTDLFGNGLVDFSASAAALRDGLRKDGHLVVTCDHGLGHTLPAGGPAWARDFLLQHVWGEWPGPLGGGLGAGYPDYCELAP